MCGDWYHRFVYLDMIEEVAAWIIIIAEEGSIPICKLDSLLQVSDIEIYRLLISIDINEEKILAGIFGFLEAKRTNDSIRYLKAVKVLVNNTLSPFRVSKQSSRFPLPVPTVMRGSAPTASEPRIMQTSGQQIRLSRRAIRNGPRLFHV